jgi:hypothetical protein
MQMVSSGRGELVGAEKPECDKSLSKVLNCLDLSGHRVTGIESRLRSAQRFPDQQGYTGCVHSS